MKTIFVVITSAFLSLASRAQPPAPVQRLDGTSIPSETLTARLQHMVDSASITGLSVVVINNNTIAYRKTFGWADKETNTALNDSTEMYAASFTKPVSAYLFLKLAEQGFFNADTPLYKYLKHPIGYYEKWQDLAREKEFEKITPAMILSHSSGLPILRFLYYDTLRLIATPGTKFYYSNEGMNLLGFVIEEYTGKKLEQLAEDLIFTPLHMPHTSMVWQPVFDANYALGYDKNGQVMGMAKRPVAKAAGSMTTTAADYANFIIALLKQRGLSQKTFENMFAPHIQIISTRGFGPARDSLAPGTTGLAWGLGTGLFQSVYGQAFFHAGHDYGWQNYFVAYPDKKTAVILMSNSSNFEPAAQLILQACIADEGLPLQWLGYYDGNQ